MSSIYFSTFVGLLAISLAAAMPISRREIVSQKTGKNLPLVKVLSRSTGKFLSVDEDGIITANEANLLRSSPFEYRTIGNKHIFRSNVYGGFLHIELVRVNTSANGSLDTPANGTLDVPANETLDTPRNESLVNESTGTLKNDSTDLLLNETTDALNDSLSLNESTLAPPVGNETTNASGPAFANETIIRLLVGDVSSNETHFHEWNIKTEVSGTIQYYFIVLPDGRRCYLAFEDDGLPVEDPCSEDLGIKAQIQVIDFYF